MEQCIRGCISIGATTPLGMHIPKSPTNPSYNNIDNKIQLHACFLQGGEEQSTEVNRKLDRTSGENYGLRNRFPDFRDSQTITDRGCQRARGTRYMNKLN